jgi:uncharacterized protein (DUF58 family)
MMGPGVRRLLLSVLVFVFLLLGLATLDGRLMALTIPLVVYLVVAMLYGPGEPSFDVTRLLSEDRVYEGTPVSIALQITNTGARLGEVFIEDLVPDALEIVDGESRVFASLAPGESIQLDYGITGTRGHFELDAVQVTVGERLGLFQRRTILPADGHLSILPKAWTLKRVAIRPLRTRGYAGPVPARRSGPGIDFYGVREYQLGDPRRWINWRVSARHTQALFTNEFERERIADVGLILDARLRMDVHVDGDSLFEHSVRATASLAEAFLRDGNRVGLLVYGEYLDWTLPGYGKIQRERILQSLARAEPGASQVFDKLHYLPVRLFPAQSQLVVVSALCRDDLSMLLRLRARGYQVLIVRPDPIGFEVRALEPGPEVELAARFAYVERKLLLLKLRRAGIQVVDWRVDKPFDQTIHGSLGRVPQWFRAVGLET